MWEQRTLLLQKYRAPTLLFLGLALIIGLGIGLHRGGWGVDYRCTSLAARTVFVAGRYTPVAAECSAPYPPYFYTLYWPLAATPGGWLASIALNVVGLVLLAAALGASPGRGLLLVLSVQSVGLTSLNNPQFFVSFGLALLVWALKRRDRPLSPAAMGAALVLLLAKPQQVVLLPFVLLAFLPWRTQAWAGLTAVALLAVSFSIYGVWLPVWGRYLLEYPPISGDWDNLFVDREGARWPMGVIQVVRAALILGFLAYLWRVRRKPDGLLWATAVALGLGNVLSLYSNLVGSLPVLAFLVALAPLPWSAALVLGQWACTLFFAQVMGQVVVGFSGFTAPLSLLLLALARRKGRPGPSERTDGPPSPGESTGTSPAL